MAVVIAGTPPATKDAAERIAFDLEDLEPHPELTSGRPPIDP
ncbi:hypothetical protein [Rhodovulum sp. YEN HP10]